MRAVVASGPGGPDVLSVTDLPDLEPGPGEILVRVAAAGLNRGDLVQREGLYPLPPSTPDVMGLECSGTVAGIGPGVDGWAVGDEVCALLAGGGYAELVTVPAGLVMPVPDGVDLVSAAALPEVACTVWSNLSMVARLRAHETILVHGGAGGVGTLAIQLAHQLGARVLTTAGTADKLERCVALGAQVGINYREQDFVEAVLESSDGGVDVILDIMGGLYLERNVEALKIQGRLVIIGLQGGTTAELDIGKLLTKRGAVFATNLRGRPIPEKAEICSSVVNEVWPLIAHGLVRPMVHGSFPMEDVAAAHTLLESGEHTGKVLLTT